MIAKRVPRTKGTSSAARLVRYMVAAQGGIEPESWARTADYILATGSKTSQGERVASFRVTNCGTDDPAHATTIIEATQKANTRSKADKTYHLVFSFPPGENPPLDVLHAIEDELCAAIGYADHQRISAVHIDTDHLHVHVAINKVHPTGLQNIEPYFDKQRLMEACERLEIQYGLQRTNHGIGEQQNERPDRIRLGPGQQPHERDSRFRAYLRESYNLALTDPPEAKTLHGLRNLSGCHMARTAEGASVLLPGNARDRVEQRGEEPADSVRRAGNGHRADAGQRRVGGRAADMEAHSAVESLTGYVAREVAPAMRKATSWQEVHTALAEHGLEIKLRGAGLVIGDPGLQLWTKASECGRDLAFKPMTDRLGPFEPSADQKQRPRKAYQPRPTQPHPSSSALFAEYQRQRQASIAARKKGLEQIKRDAAAYRAQLQSWRATQRMMLKVGGKGVTRRVMAVTIRQQAEAAKAQYRKALDEKRQRLFADTTMPTWADWLGQRAQQGDLDALAILRSREEREQRMRGDLLTAERADRARNVVMASLRPQARKDGALAYRTADGGMVIDRKTHVQAQKATAGAALVALTLAARRFEGQALIVEGSEQFRQEVAQLAGLHGVNVRFADPAMEQARQAVAATKAEAPTKPAETPTPATPMPDKNPAAGEPGDTSKAPEKQGTAVAAWIEKRNATRDRVSSIDYTRLWLPSDAGPAIYQGRRRMEDGSEVLLLKRGNEMLVKPSGPRVVAKASKWKVGRAVVLDARGRFLDNSNSVEL